MNAPDHHGQGPKDPEFDDTFDHFFKGRPQRDPDETRPVPSGPPQSGPDDATHMWAGGAAGPQDGYVGQQPPGDWNSSPVPPDDIERRRSGAVLPVLVIVASLIVVAVVVYFALGKNGSNAPTQAGTSPLPTASGPASPQPSGSDDSSSSSSSSSPSSSPSSSSSSSSSAPLPKGSSDCHSSTYSVGPKTSCEFGASVAAAAASAKFSGGSATLKGVYSPETKRNYTLTCTDGGYLTCVTKTGAIVYVQKP